MNRHPVMHGPRPLSRYPLLFLTLAVIPLCCAAAPIYTVIGEDLPLRGTAPGSDFIYLFLTGPNLPAEGISLAGGTPVTTGVPGSFTRVEVMTDGTWAYTWRTGSIGRVLDQGTYTIFSGLEPRSRSDLDDSVFTTQTVIFGAPVETVTATVAESGGSLTVDSTPGMSIVTLDGHTAGITPDDIRDSCRVPHPCRHARRLFGVQDGLRNLGGGEAGDLCCAPAPHRNPLEPGDHAPYDCITGPACPALYRCRLGSYHRDPGHASQTIELGHHRSRTGYL